MTRKEAEAFLDRNPRIRKTLPDMAKDDKIWPMIDRLWLFYALNETDATTNLKEVAKAMGWDK